MKKDVHHSGRKRSGDTEVAKPLVYVDEMAKAAGRSSVLSRKLLSQQKRIPEAQRPLHQIQSFPEIVRHIREYMIPEHQKHFDSPIDRAVLQRLSTCLTEPVTPCLSFHFPLPGCATQLIEKLEDWDEIQDTMLEWATRELDAIACVFIDVENLSEGCRECIGFTQHCFPDLDADEALFCDDKIVLGWRYIGNQLAITNASFDAGKASVDTGQFGIPEQEISDLFNRSLPPELTMVYFDADESNGLYVLMKTADLGRIESIT